MKSILATLTLIMSFSASAISSPSPIRTATVKITYESSAMADFSACPTTVKIDIFADQDPNHSPTIHSSGSTMIDCVALIATPREGVKTYKIHHQLSVTKHLPSTSFPSGAKLFGILGHYLRTDIKGSVAATHSSYVVGPQDAVTGEAWIQPRSEYTIAGKKHYDFWSIFLKFGDIEN